MKKYLTYGAYAAFFMAIAFGGKLMNSCNSTGSAKKAEATPEKITYEYVDLGLPSGKKWAAHNVGASRPEEAGNYYAWGEIEPKKVYNQETYAYVDYDVAYEKWGKMTIKVAQKYDVPYSWCIPSAKEWNELINHCDWKKETLNGVEGFRVTGSNGNSIFLPGASAMSGEEKINNIFCGYWSATKDKYGNPEGFFCTTSGRKEFCGVKMFNGLSVRPVLDGNRGDVYSLSKSGSSVKNSNTPTGGPTSSMNYFNSYKPEPVYDSPYGDL